MAPSKKAKRAAAAAKLGLTYQCVVGSSKLGPETASLVLFVESSKAQRVHKALLDSTDGVYSEWELDGSKVENVVFDLPKCLSKNIVLLDVLPDKLPQDETQLIGLLMKGKMPPTTTKYLEIEIRDGKRDYAEAAVRVYFSSRNEDLLNEMNDTLSKDAFECDGDCCYVGSCSIIRNKAKLPVGCSIFNLKKGLINVAKEVAEGKDGYEVHEFLRGISG